MHKSKSLLVLLSVTIISGNANADIWSKARDRIFRKTITVVTLVTGVVAKVGSSLNIGQCDAKKLHGINTYCFNSTEQSKIDKSLATLKKHPFMVKYKSKNLDAYKEVSVKTKQIANMDSKTANIMFPQSLACPKSKNLLGCHSQGTTHLTAAGLKLDRVKMSALLLHEASHYGMVKHTCGDSADKDTSGPYGLEAFYLVGQFHNGINNAFLGKLWDDDVTLGEGFVALSRAMSIGQYQMCDNKKNYDQIANYIPTKK